MRDYDGFISDWVQAEILPPNLAGIFDKVTEAVPEGDRIVELGCGNGILAAAMAKAGYNVIAVDKRYPAVTEGFGFLLGDANTDDFFQFLVDAPVVVGRRTFCLFYSDEWMAKLNASPVQQLVIESLDGEKHVFRNALIESKYLQSHGWSTEVDGKYIVASRQLKKQSPKRAKAEVESLPAE